MSSGEGTINEVAVFTQGFLEELANKTNGIVYVVQHRCYNYTVFHKEMSEDDLIYCTSKQSLLDLVDFIKLKNRDLHAGTKWITSGCSYPGRLAIQLRGMYPDLVFGALASGAPIVAQDNLVPEVLWDVLNSIAANCESPGPHFVNHKYVLDNYTIDDKVRKLLQGILTHGFMQIVQGNIHIDEYNNSITDYCRKIGFGKRYARRILAATEIGDEQNIHRDRIWFRQVCNEFGWLAVGCEKSNGSFWSGENLQKAIARNNEEMDHMLNSTSRTILVYGSMDYWRLTLGTRSYPGVKIFYVSGGSHCSELFEYRSETEYYMVRDVQVKILKTISQWLQEKQ